ncbi:MAG: hypothetical protein AAFQ41_14610 [Cyanobacteria bacterium J06623_7]
MLTVVAILFLLNLLESQFILWLNDSFDIQSKYDIESLPQYFNFDKEANFPSVYSALTLAFCSYLLAIIASFHQAKQSPWAKNWKWLSIIFIGLAIDEICSIHEVSIPILRTVIDSGGWLYFPWILPASILVIIFLFSFRKFIFNLPPKTRTLFVLAGAIYLAGAIGMEAVGGYIADTPGLYLHAYAIAATIEELLEMLGIIIFIHALLAYIQSQLSNLHLTYSFDDHQPKRTAPPAIVEHTP